MPVFNALFYIVFILAAIVLVVVILLQEGKGGGLGGGLGGAGQETFGVGASGINKFTAIVAAVFLGSAVLIHYFNREGSASSLVGPGATISPPLDGEADPGGGAGTTPGGGGDTGTTPPADDGN